jgi:hypothetical protein
MNEVAKGQWDKDRGYLYTCGNCNGRGQVRGEVCDHCYALDYDALMYAFRVARGSRYYALLKAILSIKGKEIYDTARQIKANTDKIVIADLFALLVQFQFPPNRMKPLVEWLEETQVCPSGAYERLKERGLKIRQGLDVLGYAEYQ